MKKRKLLVGSLSILLVSLFSLVGCDNGSTSSTTTTTTSTTTTTTTTAGDTIPDINNDENYEKARTTYVENDVTKDLNMRTFGDNTKTPTLSSLEEQHVLVVPFGFTGAYDYVARQTEETIEEIRLTFNGTDEEIAKVNGWMSVSQYYEKSSFGKSDVTFDVLPTWCIYEGNPEALGGGANAAIYARTWYVNQYNSEDHGLLGKDAKPIDYYDADNDGVIDLMWLVYSHPETGNQGDWWAYVTWLPDGQGQSGSAPVVATLGWASLDFMTKAYSGYDAHTFVHETGHTFGLSDYYDYNGYWAPLGGIDMMDHNLGDHSAFSKFTLGWLQPWVVDEPGQIVLRPTATTGDCFIIPSPNYNGTAFDEYFMIELMAPVGNAQKDYQTGYEGQAGYSQPGIRITHIDARVYSNDWSTYLVENPEDGVGFRVENSHRGRGGIGIDGDFWPTEQNSSEGTSFSLISIIDANTPDKNGLNTANYSATNDSLYVENSRFIINDQVNAISSKYLPSGTNLWNKAKTITKLTGEKQTYEIDESMTMNINLRVEKITTDDEYGYKALITINSL